MECLICNQEKERGFDEFICTDCEGAYSKLKAQVSELQQKLNKLCELGKYINNSWPSGVKDLYEQIRDYEEQTEGK